MAPSLPDHLQYITWKDERYSSRKKLSREESPLRVLNYIFIYYGFQVCQNICSISHGEIRDIIQGKFQLERKYTESAQLYSYLLWPPRLPDHLQYITWKAIPAYLWPPRWHNSPRRLKAFLYLSTLWPSFWAPEASDNCPHLSQTSPSLRQIHNS